MDEIVTNAAERFTGIIGAEDDEILALAAEDEIEAWSGMDGVIAIPALDVVVAP